MQNKKNRPLTPEQILRGMPQILPGLSPERRRTNIATARAQITLMRRGDIPETEERQLQMMEEAYGLR